MAEELNFLPESFVFVDDNPAERAIIRQQVPGVPVPEIGQVEHYINVTDRFRFFEVTNLSKDDLKRNEMYKENVKRAEMQASFVNYEDYLLSLKITSTIKPFESIYVSRIAQLTNRSNQFNLTTKRYTQEEIEAAAADPKMEILYGKLEDCFGDNGGESVVIAEEQGDALDIILWLMSCRVLRRDMEFAMTDELVAEAQKRSLKKFVGHYYPTAKNAMVREFYALQGFTKVAEDNQGNTRWELDLTNGYEKKQYVIQIQK